MAPGTLARILQVFCFVLGTTYSFISSASLGISAGAGHGLSHITPFRLGIQKTFSREIKSDYFWPIWGYWEGAFYSMNGKPCATKPGSNKHLDAMVAAGVIRFEKNDAILGVFPYVELGIGISYITRQEIGGRDLGTPFLFEDRFGLGARFGENKQMDLTYRLVHFSNAYMGPCNHGINLHLIVLGYWFK